MPEVPDRCIECPKSEDRDPDFDCSKCGSSEVKVEETKGESE